MVELSPTGEIASFLDVNQFQPGRTQFACGFFACAIVKSMAAVHQQPTQTAQEMIAEAEQWYGQFDGDNSIRNMDGMSLDSTGETIPSVTHTRCGKALSISSRGAYNASQIESGLMRAS